MKKALKIIGIGAAVILVLFGISVLSNKLMQNKAKNERKNIKSLMEYVKSHDNEHIKCYSSDDCYVMHFEAENFKCDALDNSEIDDLTYNTIITKDNSIYNYSFTELFSNDQNCKKVEIDGDVKIKIKKNQYILGTDNEVYTLGDLSNGHIELNKYSNSYFGDIIKEILNNNEIKSLINIKEDYTKKLIYAIVLKTDNNLYKLTYKINSNYTDVSLSKDELSETLEKYGNIKYVEYSGIFNSQDGTYHELDEDRITKIISDKGYYYLTEVVTEECKKYQDIECELELKESEIFNKFKKDIKYGGQRYTVLSDNSVINTNYLTYPLDSDLKD